MLFIYHGKFILQVNYIFKKNNLNLNSNFLTVLVGPTAVGKGSVSSYIRKHYSSKIWVSVSATTRSPRPGERNGIHYFFKTHNEFNKLIKENKFIEWAVVHGVHKYGTLKQLVNHEIKNGKKILLEIDIEGARQVKKKYPKSLFVFLAPPSLDEMKKRLHIRSTEGIQEKRRRLRTAKIEMKAVKEFEKVVVNKTIIQAAEELVSLMKII